MTVCDDTAGHCITCSDEAVPMRVLQEQPGSLALCLDDKGAQHQVMTDLVASVATGDVLLVHAGVALLVADAERTRP